VPRKKGESQMTYRTAVRFPSEAGEQLEGAAKEMGVAPAVVVRLWVMEKLRERATQEGHIRKPLDWSGSKTPAAQKQEENKPS